MAIPPSAMTPADIAATGYLPVDLVARDRTSPGRIAAQRILRSAARPLTSIETVLTTPVVHTYSTNGGASTLNTAATSPTVLTGSVPVTNDKIVTPIAGPWGVAPAGAPQQQIQGYSNLAGTARLANTGAGMRFGFKGQVFELNASFVASSNGIFIGYATDLKTGLRARFFANDSVTSGISGPRFHKFDLGYDAPLGWGIKIYGSPNLTTFASLNCAATDYFFGWRMPDEARLMFCWDSWGNHTLDGGTNNIKLAIPDYISAGLGQANPANLCRGSTGYLATNSGADRTFGQRIAAGDYDNTRVGDFDLFMLPASINDFNSGQTATEMRVAIEAALPRARQAQPNAVMLLWGPQNTSAAQPTQAWFDAARLAVSNYVAASGDVDVIYIDNSPTGENWVPTAVLPLWFTGSVVHANDVGKVQYAQRVVRSTIGALRSKYNL
jgi:hypothetical protein